MKLAQVTVSVSEIAAILMSLFHWSHFDAPVVMEVCHGFNLRQRQDKNVQRH